MPRGPLSVQLYSVRQQIAEDLEGTLERIAGLGFTAVEPYGDFIPGSDRYVAAFAATGLTAPSAHAPVLQLGDPSGAFEAAVAIGVRTIIDPAHRTEEWESIDGIARIAERINMAAERAREYGLTFGYHNHWWELESRPNGTPALELLAARLDPTVVLEVDTYWVEVGGLSAPDLLGRLGDRVQLIHVKDGPKTLETTAQLPAGQGVIDIPAVLAAAPQATRVLEFDDYDGDLFNGLAVSLTYVTAQDAESGE
ncbi:sugar phosphate isomerase/epimerase family protein [uncultured Amnibacterium sp.]|uniref:sugar phosphate isomerase/epimerase family protein n=1 Tax=uncultured Amnibacterium sp. TaxID=1631851 RepID=UPI0035CA5C73